MLRKICFYVIALLLLFVQTEASAILERESLKYFPGKCFVNVGIALEKERKIKYYSSLSFKSLYMIEQKFKDVLYNPAGPSKLEYKPNEIIYTFNGLNWAFAFNVSYLYEYRFLGYPLTGVMDLQYTLASTIFHLNVLDETITGTLDATLFSVQLASNSNPLVIIFGVNELLNKVAIEAIRHYNVNIRKNLNSAIKAYYLSAFGDHWSIITFPDFDNIKVLMRNRLSSIIVNGTLGLQFNYIDIIKNYPSGSLAIPKGRSIVRLDDNFLRKIIYDFEVLAWIINIPISTIKNFTITTNDIADNYRFKLNKDTLQIIFPDITLMENKVRDICMILDSVSGNLDFETYVHPQIIIYNNIMINLTLNCTLDDKPATLFKSMVAVSLVTKPILTWKSKNLQVNFNLNMTSSTVSLSQVYYISNVFNVYNANGIPSLLKLYLDEYLIPKKQGIWLLGTGLNLSTHYVANSTTSKPIIVDTGVEITLYK